MSQDRQLDLSTISRRTVEERDYWIDQLVTEIKRLRALATGQDLRALELSERALNAEAEALRLEVLLNTPEIKDFAQGVVLEAAHQRERWDDSRKTDFDWAAVANYLAAKALLNPPQNDGTSGKAARLHRLIALGALTANWHVATLLAPEDE